MRRRRKSFWHELEDGHPQRVARLAEMIRDRGVLIMPDRKPMASHAFTERAASFANSKNVDCVASAAAHQVNYRCESAVKSTTDVKPCTVRQRDLLYVKEGLTGKAAWSATLVGAGCR